MAATKNESLTPREVETAIARVLAAERDARDAIAAGEREAEALRAATRTREKRIAERAAQRIAAIRAGMAAKLAGRLAAIEAEAVAPDPEAARDEAARARLEAAVERLADELSGARS
jgi:creatinine amidohydrolase/Fe(II)-dependent formamide hydrolase-like protein